MKFWHNTAFAESAEERDPCCVLELNRECTERKESAKEHHDSKKSGDSKKDDRVKNGGGNQKDKDWEECECKEADEDKPNDKRDKELKDGCFNNDNPIFSEKRNTAFQRIAQVSALKNKRAECKDLDDHGKEDEEKRESK